MKRIILALVAIGVVFFTGCSSNKLDIDKNVKNDKMASELDGAPNWVMSHPKDDDYIYGLCVASPIGDDISLQRTIAIGNARNEISREIKTKVENMLKTYKNTTGSGSDKTFDKAITDVSKQVSSTMLMGSSQYKDSWWISKSGKLYILIAMPKKNIKNAIESGLKSSFKNDKATWSEFQSKKAQEELSREIEKSL